MRSATPDSRYSRILSRRASFSSLCSQRPSWRATIFRCSTERRASRYASSTGGGSAEGPLSGVRVLDLGRILAMPFCSMQLGDMGAEVIKVERIDTGDDTRTWGPPFSEKGGESAYFLSVNRNKKSIALDLKKKEGVEIVYDLVKKSDVFLENFPPGKAAALGLHYDLVAEKNPRIIYASLTGYGPSGPYKDRLAYDVMVSAVGGLMSITGPQDGEPVKVGVALTDITAGLFCHGAVIAALYARQRTGRGQLIETSLLESQVASLVNAASSYLVGGVVPKRMGTAHASIVPYQSFPTKDGYMVVGALNDSQYQRLVTKVLNREDLANDERFRTNPLRVKHRKELISVLSELFTAKTTKEWQADLDKAHVPCGPINSIKDVFEDPQVLHRNMLTEIQHPTAGTLKMTGVPVKLSDTPTKISLPPPTLGQHTRDILEGVLNYPKDRIQRLFDEKICA